MARPLFPAAQAVIARDIRLGLLEQRQTRWRRDLGRARRAFVDQPVQQIEHMGLGRHPGLKRQFHRTKHRFFVVLQHQGEDLHHLPVAARVFQQMLLEAPEGLGQLGKKARSP